MICSLLGSTTPFSDTRLAELYPTHATYEQRFAESADATIAAGSVSTTTRRADGLRRSVAHPGVSAASIAFSFPITTFSAWTPGTRPSRPSSGARPGSSRASSGRATVADLDDATRAKRLAAAVRDAGWLELRDDAGDGRRSRAASKPRSSPTRSAARWPTSRSRVPCSRPTSPAGPARRRPTARVVAFSADLLEAARVTGSATTAPLHAVDGAAEPVDGVYTLVSEPGGYRLAVVPVDEARALGRWCRPHARRAPCRAPARPVAPVANGRLLTADDLAAWTALGLALTSADLVGVMRGVLDVTVAYAAERRQYGVPVGSFQAVQHLLAEAHCLMEGSLSVALHASWAVDNLAPDDALAAGASPRRTAHAAARTVCETAIQVHGGIGNTWECIAHVYLRRALLSSQWFGDDGVQLLALQRTTARGGRWTFVTRPPKPSSAPACAPGSPTTIPACPASSTDDEYWARQAEWHTALYDAGFFGLSWPARFGGHDLPTVFDVILDEELAAAGAPPRPSLGYLVQGISDARQRRDQGPLPARADQRAASAGARASASPTPAPTSPRCARPRRATATST